MIKNLILISLSISFISSLSFGLSVHGIHLDNNIPKSEQVQIVNDISYLANLKSDIKVDKELLKILRVKKLSAKDLLGILNYRVKYVINEDWDFQKNVETDESKNVEYLKVVEDYTDSKANPFNSLMYNNEGKGAAIAIAASNPGVETPSVDIVPETPNVMTTIMRNISNGVYSFGKEMNSLAYAVMNDGTKIEATTNNIGLIQIGAGLFSEDLALKKMDVNAEVNIIGRLKTYFHEGQHSLGNGAYAGFSHQQCPSGHPFEKDYACDSVLNGSYSFEAYIGKSLMSSAKKLSEKDKEMLRLDIADMFSRVVGITEDRIDHYKSELRSLKIEFKSLIQKPKENSDEIRKMSDQITVIETMLKNPKKFSLRYVDDVPEEVKFLGK